MGGHVCHSKAFELDTVDICREDKGACEFQVIVYHDRGHKYSEGIENVMKFSPQDPYLFQ